MALNVLHYWRNSLADEEKLGLTFKEMEAGKKFPVNKFKQGWLPSADIHAFFKKDDPNTLPVIIALYAAVKKSQHGIETGSREEKNIILPLWLTASLTRDGELIPAENSYPWMGRENLSPNEKSHTSLIFGDVAAVDEFYTQNRDRLDKTNSKNWKDVIELTQELFDFVSGKNKTNTIEKSGYLLKEWGYILPLNTIRGASYHIIKTYDQYLFDRTETLPSILTQFCGLTNQIPGNEKTNLELFLAGKSHLGQMQKKYPLALSQRTSFAYFSDTEKNDIFTVQGPPGTGKTSLLLTVIASLWVENAVHQKRPPIIVAASTNNQAVTNILDQFQAISTDIERWLPDINTYGLYLASQRKEGDAQKAEYIYRLKQSDTGSLNKFSKSDYLVRASQFFLTKFNSFYKKEEKSLQSCQSFLHEQLRQQYNTLLEIITLKADIDDIEKIPQNKLDLLIAEKDKELELFKTNLLLDFLSEFSIIKFHFKPVIAYCDKKLQHEKIKKDRDALLAAKEKWCSLDKKRAALEEHVGTEMAEQALFTLSCHLDITLRHELFLLATHYWEVTFLLEDSTKTAKQESKAENKTYWEKQAMLMPCFVTTLHTGPSFFQYKAAGRQFKTLADFIDLVVIDEAGQVMPSLAAALISVSKRAFFVGDIHQIEPVVKLPENIDVANTKKFKLANNENDYKALKTAGILCSGNSASNQAYGNLTIIGQRKAKYPGLMLKEHRRCAKDIIRYCNELCYENALIPSAIEKPCIYPRMGYAHIRGQEEKWGASRSNKYEAHAIAQWIIKNKENILQTCDARTLDDCVGIVTPFAAQASLIKSYLHKVGLFIQKVGTIHTLQGAEKPIIIFSPVYTAGRGSGEFFFDKSPNMLNVAVSRAKQSFLIFGDMDTFDSSEGTKPSSLLAKHIFSHENNEIVDVIQPRFHEMAEEEIEQINSLEKHQFILKKSFEEAKEMLNIVSPFLRTNAIYHDNIPDLIKQYAKDIKIVIYTDPTFNKDNPDFDAAKKILESSGADVFLVKNVHSKIITIDNHVIIEGSFNWLSAARSGSYFMREESSIIYRGLHAPDFIQQALDPIKKKIQYNQTPKRI